MLIRPMDHYGPEVLVDGEWVGLFDAYAWRTSALWKLPHRT
jgi:hypothetical protein